MVLRNPLFSPATLSEVVKSPRWAMLAFQEVSSEGAPTPAAHCCQSLAMPSVTMAFFSTSSSAPTACSWVPAFLPIPGFSFSGCNMWLHRTFSQKEHAAVQSTQTLLLSLLILALLFYLWMKTSHYQRRCLNASCFTTFAELTHLDAFTVYCLRI